jgi:hypothetical protein
MFRAFIFMCAVAAASGCAADGPRGPSEAACEQALEHELALRLPSGMPDDLRERHRATIASNLGEDYVARCTQQWSSQRLDCITSAETLESARACAGTQE